MLAPDIHHTTLENGSGGCVFATAPLSKVFPEVEPHKDDLDRPTDLWLWAYRFAKQHQKEPVHPNQFASRSWDLI